MADAPEPPPVSDSDLISLAIVRLQRAVAKMQAHEYDDELNEHLERAAGFLAWVAESMLAREIPPMPGGAEPE